MTKNPVPDVPAEIGRRIQPRIPAASLLTALALVAAGAAAAMLLALAALTAPPHEVELAGYATPLAGRTAAQRHNARLSAQALDGQVIPPGADFSFNKSVGSWTVDRGYVKAPVSFDGELVRAFGGGVCQTSTTLYNAVLLAGLPVLERHAHVFAPTYVTPGRDAAVAQYDIDLRFANPYPWPVRIRARIQGDRVEVRLFGWERPRAGAEVVTEVLSTTAPARLTRVMPAQPGTPGGAYLRAPGANGYRVVTLRVFHEDGRGVRREQLSDDTYQAMNRVVALMQEQTP